MKPYIFISYAHKDNQTVIPIIDELRASGVEIWYDEGIEAGTEWPETIEKKLVGCSRVIAFISPASVKSQNCRNEINLALSLGKEMLTVYLSETTLTGGMSLQLGTIQAIFKYRHPSHRSFMQALLGSEFLAGYLGGGAPTPAPRAVTREERRAAERVENPLDVIARAASFSTVKLGRYPQSTMNPEPIKWIVVKKSCGEALLVSRDVLDCRDFGEPHEWSRSSMRSWLNGEFASTAFTPTELGYISENERFTDTSEGVERTAERIFLLDVAEVREHFGKWLRARHMNPKVSAYAKRKGAYIDKKLCVWWLRCSSKASTMELMSTDFDFAYNHIPLVNGRRPSHICYHHTVQGKNAMTTYRGANPTQVLAGIGVRPAIWVRYI